MRTPTDGTHPARDGGAAARRGSATAAGAALLSQELAEILSIY
jgi:hypothetical protein